MKFRIPYFSIMLLLIVCSCQGATESVEQPVNSETVVEVEKKETVVEPEEEVALQMTETQAYYLIIAKQQFDVNERDFIRFCYFVKSSQAFLLEYIDFKNFTPEKGWYDLDEKIGEAHRETDFFAVFQEFLLTLDEGTLEKTVEELRQWLVLEAALNLPIYFDEETAFEEKLEVIAMLEETEELVTRHLSMDAQSWDSLASSQATEVFYGLWAYLDSLSPADRLCFMKKDYEAVCTIVNR